ncbi:hypothetical protein GCM10017673_31010 [Streptosporangium violaceochromogenes]|nr:hypothetical protein GCM10017673_31010 [Streptosporangium violaceochromogenes]
MTATGLRRFRGAPPAKAARCEMCAEPAGETHGHVVNTENRALLCVCRGCYLLFTQEGATRRRYRSVPERYLRLPSFRLTEADWEELQIPVRTAFFFHNSVLGRTVALYPSPAGATESLLPLATWERVTAANPLPADVRPDVEALLIDRPPRGESTCHLVPIDACYELVGLVRLHWKGFDGGREARRVIDGFFTSLRLRGRTAPAKAPVPARHAKAPAPGAAPEGGLSASRPRGEGNDDE